MQVGRLPLEQQTDGLVDGDLVDGMVVIQDQQAGGRAGSHIVDQLGDQDVDGGQAGRLEQTRHDPAQAGLHRLQGGDQVGEKARGVVVAPVQREPGHLWPASSVIPTVDPLDHQGGLAIAGGGRHQRQATTPAPSLFQALDQARSRHEIGSQCWDGQLGREQGRAHLSPAARRLAGAFPAS